MTVRLPLLFLAKAGALRLKKERGTPINLYIYVERGNYALVLLLDELKYLADLILHVNFDEALKILVVHDNMKQRLFLL